MRVLVTGGDGFIGRRLIAQLNAEVLNIDEVHDLDVCDPATMSFVREFDPHVIYHLAAKHFIPWCREHPEETWRTNVGGTRTILEAAGPALSSVVLASSAAVYGYSDQPLAEYDPVRPVDVYGESKVEAENLLRAFAASRPVSVTAARLFNVVGPGDRTAHLLPHIAGEIAAGRTVGVGNTWPERDYIHVADVVDALQTLAHNAGNGFSAYNVCTGWGATITEVLGKFSDELERAIPTEVLEYRMRANDGNLVGDPMRIWQDFAWEPRRSLADAVHDLMEETVAA